MENIHAGALMEFLSKAPRQNNVINVICFSLFSIFPLDHFFILIVASLLSQQEKRQFALPRPDVVQCT